MWPQVEPKGRDRTATISPLGECTAPWVTGNKAQKRSNVRREAALGLSSR
ncbi:hypothetical protein RvVAR031_pl03800 (plasmid) [Agrobacterium vitis]|nr:hypothetical protein RvVAR031_pl03800 [Agrobacterium vitis]